MELQQSEHQPLDHAAMEAQLALLREQRQPYPGYPDVADRLVADPQTLERTPDGRFVLPRGPWSTDDLMPTAAELAEITARGYELDADLRPLHPWFARIVADPLIGVVLGKGKFRRWGAGHTADMVVVRDEHVLLVQRGDTGQWALPGGFLEPGESAAVAAVRELVEETGLVVPAGASLTPVYEGPVVDPRMTAHAWPETTAYLTHLDARGRLPKVRGMDDAAAAGWVPLDALRGDEVKLFGAHRFLVARALGNIGLEAARPDVSTEEMGTA